MFNNGVLALQPYSNYNSEGSKALMWTQAPPKPHPSIMPLILLGEYMKICEYYRIAGNFGKVFNLAKWQFCRKSPN